MAKFPVDAPKARAFTLRCSRTERSSRTLNSLGAQTIRQKTSRAAEAAMAYAPIEEDIHNPFAGAAVPLLGNGPWASVAIEDPMRFPHDPLRIGSDQDVGSDLACNRALRVGAHGEAGHTQHSRLLLDAATVRQNHAGARH